MRKLLTFWVLCAIPFSLGAAPDNKITQADQTYFSITLYNNGQALIKDRRKINLVKGTNSYAVYDVSPQLYPGSLFIRTNFTQEKALLKEYSFLYSKVALADLLEMNMDNQVRVYKGNGQPQQARLINVSEDLKKAYVKIGDAVEIVPSENLVFNQISRLHFSPWIKLLLSSTVNEPSTLNLTYLTKGLPWQVHYIVEVHPDEDKLDLSGSLRLTNKMNSPIKNAKVQLLVGKTYKLDEIIDDVHTDHSHTGLRGTGTYSIEQKVSLDAFESKRFPFITMLDRKIFTTYAVSLPFPTGTEMVDNMKKLTVDSFLLLKFKDEGSAQRMPEGTVWVYKRDKEARTRFLVRDTMRNLHPKGITFRYDSSQDVEARWRQTDFKRLSLDVYDSGHRLDLINKTDHPVTITVSADMKEGWKLLRTDKPLEDDGKPEIMSWRIKLPPKGSDQLRYRIRVTETRSKGEKA